MMYVSNCISQMYFMILIMYHLFDWEEEINTMQIILMPPKIQC